MPAHPVSRSDAIKAQGLEIQRARLAQGYSQPQAAEQLEVSSAAVKNWEQGRREAPEAIRKRVAKEWGGDAKKLGLDGKCPCCGRPY